MLVQNCIAVQLIWTLHHRVYQHSTIWCRQNAAQYNMIFHVALLWIMYNLNRDWAYLQASYWMFLVRISEKMFRRITAANCMCQFDCLPGQTSTYVTSCLCHVTVIHWRSYSIALTLIYFVMQLYTLLHESVFHMKTVMKQNIFGSVSESTLAVKSHGHTNANIINDCRLMPCLHLTMKALPINNVPVMEPLWSTGPLNISLLEGKADQLSY